MLHVAIMGSIERFLSVMIEHFAGAFPLWLAPVQVKVVPIGDRQANFAHDVFTELKNAGIRAEIDQSGDSLGKKVRNAKTEKIPYVMVIGDKEMQSGEMCLEGRTEKTDPKTIADIITFLKKEIEAKK